MPETKPAANQREFNFNRAAFAAALDEKLVETRGPARRVLLAWFDARLGHVDVHPSVKSISQHAGVSSDTVRRVLRELEALAQPGIIITRRRRPDGSWLPIEIKIGGELFDGTSTARGYPHASTPLP